MTELIVGWVVMAMIAAGITATLIKHDQLKADRNEAYDYILTYWRYGRLQEPPSKELRDKLNEYTGSQEP